MNPDSGYRRCLLKISGEAFGGERGFGIEESAIARIAGEIATAYMDGRQLAVVVGAGNIVRGSDSASIGVPPIVGDHMGMIATVLNALALKWALSALNIEARVMCAFSVSSFVEPFDGAKALDYLSNDIVVLFAGGTGNPCFTTDSAAALRAVEIDADVVIKATQTDGVFDKDPHKHSDAVLFASITPQEVLERRLGVMDAASIEILGRKSIPTIVLNLHREGAMARALAGERLGTIIAGD